MNAEPLPIPAAPVAIKRLATQRSAVLLVLIVSLAILLPAIIFGIPSNLDLSNHFRFALPFYDALRSGDLYPGWLAESNSGYGDPSFRFYPPAFYYLLAGARGLTGSWYTATLVVFTALSTVGALGVYFWARTFLSQTAAAWAGIFYAIAPYHVNQLYQATLFAEYAAAAVLPFAFAFVDRVCIHGRRRDIAGLAFVYAILLFTHLPLAIIGSLALLVYSAVYLSKSRKLITIAKLSLAVGLGLCASAVYWVTMIAEMSWIAINRVHPDASVDYRANFVLQTISSDNLNVWWMNILSLMTLLLFAPLVVFLRRSSAAQSKTLKCLLPVIVMTLCASFMALSLSRPLWDVWPQLQQVQFPWRWLALVSMGGSLIAGAAVSTWKANQQGLPSQWRTVVLGAMIISIAFTLSHVVREAQYLSPAKFEETLSEIRGSASVNYWFPIWANSNAPQMHHQIEVDSRQLSIYSWQAEHRQFAVAAGPATEARVRTFYYPHWSATTNGISLPTRPAADGALLISLPTEAVRVSLDFREPARNRFSAAASLTGLCLIAALAFPLRKQRT